MPLQSSPYDPISLLMQNKFFLKNNQYPIPKIQILNFQESLKSVWRNLCFLDYISSLKQTWLRYVDTLISKLFCTIYSKVKFSNFTFIYLNIYAFFSHLESNKTIVLMITDYRISKILKTWWGPILMSSYSLNQNE